MYLGEKRGWERLAGLDTDNVCKKADVSFESGLQRYVMGSFGLNIFVSIRDKSIFCDEEGNDLLTSKLWEYAGLTYLWYLINAENIPLSGNLIRPDNLKGGHLFTKGTHVLPLSSLAEKYNDDIKGFFQKGEALNAERVEYGDAAIKLFPVPRVPVIIILWRGDDEFPPRADLLFDSTCELQVPVDILWSIAMMSALIIM
jgi:hypothetical protein